MSHTRAHQTQRGLMAALAAVAIVGAAAGLIGSGSLEASTVDTTPQDMQAGALPVSFADIVDRVGPAVVRVEVERSVSPMPTGADETPDHRQFERFFDDDGRKRFGHRHRQHGKRGPHQREMGGVGSGFAISPDGYIVTNDHVVARADTIRVSFEDGRTLEAELIGRDPKTDLALLKIEAHDLAFVEFADAEPRVGDWVITVGSPFGLGQTVTAGIVSARGRNIGAGPYDDFIQIDAPINRGNSGGPAFNLEGEVVGVNTALFSPTGVSAGIGFAIPAALAEDVVADLQADGAVDRGWLGVHVQGLNDVMAESLGLDEAHGAIVSHVIDDGPAAAAGIRQGDVILTVQGQAVERVRDLPRLVADLDAGERATIVVWRNGAEISLVAEIGHQPNAVNQASADAVERQDLLGMGLSALDPETRRAYGVDETVGGVVVTDVARRSLAQRNGLSRGDVIEKVGDRAVSAPADVADAVTAAKDAGRAAILLLVNRGGSERYVALPIDRG